MKKIIVFYGSYGGGHLSAAKSISSHLENTYGTDVEVKIVDCIEYINKYINKVSTEAYKELAKKAPWAWKHVYKNSQNGALSYISNTTNKLMSHKLNSLLQEFKPDLIISTHPFSTQMCAILKKRNKINCKIATVLTDYHIHAQWLVLSDFVDYFFVSNTHMKQDMIEEGIDEKKIFVTGIPVSERFNKKYNKEEICSSFGLSPDKPTVLFFAGGEFGLGRNTTYMVLKALIRLFKEVQVVAISGKNKKMNKKFQDLVEITNSSDRVKILEYTDKVPELMSISIGVITKPGGLTVTECLTSHLPIVIINPIPGQEEENAEFLVKNNVAIWIKKEDNIARTLKNLSRGTDTLAKMSKNAKALAKPNATANICDSLMDELEKISNSYNNVFVSTTIKYKNKYLFVKELINEEEILYSLEGELKPNESPENALKRLAKNVYGINLDKISKIDFETIIDENKVQNIYLIYKSETRDISVLEDNEDDSFVLISKDEFEKFKFVKPIKL